MISLKIFIPENNEDGIKINDLHFKITKLYDHLFINHMLKMAKSSSESSSDEMNEEFLKIIRLSMKFD